jgi:hypothetical protein
VVDGTVNQEMAQGVIEFNSNIVWMTRMAKYKMPELRLIIDEMCSAII